uniref:Retrovirus-related Pol polyprotein from transposon TNT 1-94 n=1 Tax=Tanacetum cinerariifolium TaxID=118510 RepID=A0A699I3H8_TANCI|nr:hypothetical protein [Tanacetum cinerariifolium]
MSGTIPPISPPFGTSSGNPGSPNVNRVDTMPTTTDPINTTTTTNMSHSVVDENLPQLLDSRGGIIISCLPNDVMKSVMKCKTAKEMWNDIILAHERPSDTRDTKIAALRLKFNAFKSLEDDEGNTKIRAFMAITEDEPSIGNADARSGQWVDITMKKVIEKWTYSKVTLDQLLSEQVYGNIVKALGGKGKRKEKISSKEVVFTKAGESSFVLAPEITSDLESDCDSHEPLPPFPKLIGAAPSGTLESVISLSDLTLNMADRTFDTPDPKKTIPSIKVSPTYVIKKKTEKSPAGPKPCSDKKLDSSI